MYIKLGVFLPNFPHATEMGEGICQKNHSSAKQEGFMIYIGNSSKCHIEAYMSLLTNLVEHLILRSSYLCHSSCQKQHVPNQRIPSYLTWVRTLASSRHMSYERLVRKAGKQLWVHPAAFLKAANNAAL